MKRSFTLIETLLAATLGTLVLMMVVGIIGVLDRAESGSVDRLARTTELEQAQVVIRRAIGSLAMAGGNAPVSNRGSAAETAPTAGQVVFTPTPRLVLAPMNMDPLLAAQTAVGVVTTTTGTDSSTSAGGELSVEGAGAQRLQIALTSLPLPEQAFVMPGGVQRNLRRALTGTAEEVEEETETPEEELETTEEESDTEEEGEDSELVPIFWGVFELTPPGPAPTSDGSMAFSSVDSAAAPVREGWTLWWRPIEPPVNASAVEVLGLAALAGTEMEPGSTVPPPSGGASGSSGGGVAAGSPSLLVDPRLDPTAVPLIRGLEMCHWSVYRGRKLMPDYAATYSGELPAYVQLEIRTTSGVYANWMFEVGWATVREPGQAEAARLNQMLTQRGGGGDGEGEGGRVNRPGGRGGPPRDGEGRIQRQRRNVGDTPIDADVRTLPRRRPEGNQ